jgi:hypothetical protein
VPDRETAELMADFYRRLLAGEGRAEALRQAQLAMRSRPGREHPFFWGAFICQGAPGPIPGLGAATRQPPARTPCRPEPQALSTTSASRHSRRASRRR